MAVKPDYKYIDGSKIFFTSDSHFFHEKIIDFCKRPFSSVDEMNEELVSRWNSTVPQDGLVFHLGDFAFASFTKWKEIRERLNGDIIFIKGNHDIRNIKSDEKYNELFKYTSWMMLIEIENRHVYLSHFPFLCYSGSYRSKDDVVYNLHGHVHTSPYSQDGQDAKRMQFAFPSQYDVGVDNNDFRPISWAEVDKKIKEQINGVNQS